METSTPCERRCRRDRRWPRHRWSTWGCVPPDVGHGQRNEFSETAGPVHAHARGMRAKMPPAGHAIAAAAAHHVAFARDQFAGMKVDDVGADLDDLADELVANGHGDRNGLLRPLVPIVDVNVGTADAGTVHADQHINNTDGEAQECLRSTGQARLVPLLMLSPDLLCWRKWIRNPLSRIGRTGAGTKKRLLHRRRMQCSTIFQRCGTCRTR